MVREEWQNDWVKYADKIRLSFNNTSKYVQIRPILDNKKPPLIDNGGFFMRNKYLVPFI